MNNTVYFHATSTDSLRLPTIHAQTAGWLCSTTQKKKDCNHTHAVPGYTLGVAEEILPKGVPSGGGGECVRAQTC